MSIPPLVCSTPPPPDQCEDDRDPEDFDIQYNLSQDDDENYDYGNFSSYNHFQAATNENKKTEVPTIAKVIVNDKDNDPMDEHKRDSENSLGTNTASEIKMKLQEDINIEDLNLIIDKEAIERINITETKDNGIESETINNNIDCSSKEPNVSVKNIVSDEGLSSLELATNELIFEPPDVDDLQIDEMPPALDEVIEDEIDNPKVDEYFAETLEINQENDDELSTIDNTFVQNIQLEEKIIKESETVHKLEVDEDFGDFDDFQFANTDTPAVLADNCDNPWNTEETKTDDSNFGDFQANFDENESNIVNKLLPNIEHSSKKPENEIEVKVPENKTEVNVPENKTEVNIPIVLEDDDDFGDFDDFKSSATENMVNSDEAFGSDQVTLLNLQSDNESQLMESVEKILSSIFEEEIPVPECEFDGKLESYLCETWGHLLEIDVRQPYIVNWNNSLGQQTLLKSLCIDSRNILFAPKRSSSMPKYAANLSAAPLQPQKQTTTTSESSIQPDKPTSKSLSTWSDPFSSDGQESCNTNPAGENAAPALRPSDLDILEASTKPKPELFSNTINIQPLRQISLPDTHIFTPTDSETPRSKTIHYNNSPSVLLPQNVTESNKSLPDALNPQPSTSSAPDVDEYWEFQNFKAGSEKPSEIQPPIEKIESTVTPKVTHGTQLLQPIKLEPIMPQLNWPDPGLVKETFEDFTDFVSNSTSTWSNDKQGRSNPIVLDDSKITSEPQNITVNNEPPIEASMSNAGDTFDDEFDTFQSALPTSKSTPEFNFTNYKSEAKPQDVLSQNTPQTSTEFDNVFPKMPKSETISFSNPIRPNKKLVQNPVNSKKSENSARSLPPMPPTSMINTNLLQPTPASSSSSQSQKKSGQILQPLSLESYSQINWPNPGIDLQDLSRFNPVETLQSLKSDLSTNSLSKGPSPIHQANSTNSQASEDDIWGEFVSSKPKQQPPPKKTTTFADDDEWTDFVSSPNVKPQNGLNTISFNVHTNLSMQKTPHQGKYGKKNNQIQLDIPSLNYITPKTTNHKTYNDRHFQNL